MLISHWKVVEADSDDPQAEGHGHGSNPRTSFPSQTGGAPALNTTSVRSSNITNPTDFVLWLKDLRVITFSFRYCNHGQLSNFVFKLQTILRERGFFSSALLCDVPYPKQCQPVSAWPVYSAEAEYKRLGIPDQRHRLTTLNRSVPVALCTFARKRQVL